MTLFLALLIWSLASVALALLVGRMMARNHGKVVEPVCIVLPMPRRSADRLRPFPRPRRS